LKQYAEWFRYYYPQQAIIEDNADKAAEQEAGDGSKPRNGIRSKWEKYKREFAATQVSAPSTLVASQPCSTALPGEFIGCLLLLASVITELVFLL
jgi:hypothetical protein